MMISIFDKIENFVVKAENAGYQYFLHLTLFPNKPWLLCVCSTSLSKTPWEKEKLVLTSNFTFSHSVSCPFRALSANFTEFRILQTLSDWKNLKLAIWERVNTTFSHTFSFRIFKTQDGLLKH